jgi:hypothetical protein
VNSKDANLLRSQLGFILSKCFCNWIAEFGLSGAYDDRLSGAKFVSNFIGSPGDFTTYGLSPSRFLALPEVKLTGLFLKNLFSVSASYQAEVGNKYYENNLFLEIGYHF